MNIVTIKFKPYFKEPLLSGVKVCTARTKRLGKPGDMFEAFGAMFEMKSVSEEQLYFVADLWHQEGCTSREHFMEVWKEIHPVAGYRPAQQVFLHRFKLVTR
jgi:hypothetical protein